MAKVYTFFGNVPAFSHEDSYRLLMLWRERWAAVGFEPIVLNEHIASRHPMWGDYRMRCSLLPSLNPQWYDQLCYWRWLAMAQVGGGIMADYDCIPYNTEEFSSPAGILPHTLVCLQGHVPALVYGSDRAYLEICKGIMKYEVGRRDFGDNLQAHVSDMTILEKGSLSYQRRNIVKMYGEVGWETASVVHYSTASMTAGGKWPKWKAIPELRS